MDDTLSNLLSRMRPHGALYSASAMNSPWSLRVEERAPLTMLATLTGSAWVRLDDAEPTSLGPGEVVMVNGIRPYVVSERPGAEPRVIIGENDTCSTPHGETVNEDFDMCRARPDSTATLLKCVYQAQGDMADRLLDTLPHLMVVRGQSHALNMIGDELRRGKPGQQAVLDRLFDLLLVSTLREWLDHPDSQAPGWYRAHGDPLVGAVLHMIHNDPAHPWTVATLAAKAGASRATVARRFTEAVGQPPMTYLAEWRLCLASEMLRDSDATVEAIARRVGYSNAYALSVAFKRVCGVRPGHHRATVAA